MHPLYLVGVPTKKVGIVWKLTYTMKSISPEGTTDIGVGCESYYI